MSKGTAEGDEVLDALDGVGQAAVATRQTTVELERKAEEMRQMRRSGRAWPEIVSAEQRPRLTELLSATLRLLSDKGVLFRRALARAMHAEGMSIEQIARQFGVSRQRISNLLRRRPA
jgi:DNA invertase Pin-like site-specific DNA recombinase